MKKATAIYARYSSHAQDGGTSIDVQLDACGRGLEAGNVRQYVDRARTGRATAGREALLQLLDDVKEGLIGRVLVYKYDRLGRNLSETSAIIAQLRQAFAETEKSLAAACTPTEFRDFMETHVGPLVLTADGKVVCKKTETASEGSEAVSMKRLLAGAGFEAHRVMSTGGRRLNSPFSAHVTRLSFRT